MVPEPGLNPQQPQAVPQPPWGPPQQYPAWAPPQPEPQLPWAPPQAAQPGYAPQLAAGFPAEYHRFWVGLKWWRPLVALIVATVLALIVSTVLVVAAILVEAPKLGGYANQEQLQDAALNSPLVIVATMLGLALILPIVWLGTLIVGQPWRFLHSVFGSFRWRLLLVAGLATAIPFGIGLALTIATGGIGELRVEPYSWWLLIALLLVTPFQSAAEEYLVRGMLNRAVGSWLPDPRTGLIVAAIVSSLVFMFLHVATDPWLNLFYFVMGLALCYLTWRTGGIEAAIGIHAVNNLFGMVLLPFQDLAQLFDRQAGVGDAAVLIQLGLVGVAVLVVSLYWRGKPRQAWVPPSR